MHSVFLPLDDHLREDQSMRGKDTQISRPKLGSRDGGSVEDESVILHVIGSSGLKVLHV